MIGPGEAAIQWAEEKRGFADELEAYAPEEAAKIRNLVTELEKRVIPLLPRWIPISELRRTTGVSLQTLRRRATEFAGEKPARARKDSSGRWEIHRAAAETIPVRHRQQPILDTDDVDELAEELGREA